MVPRSQKIRLGIFLSVTIFLLIATLVIVTGNKLLKREKTYYIRYKNISLTGLELGAQVKYQGIRIGRVENIIIDRKDISTLVVEISIGQDVPIKANTEAVMSLIGITGLKLIELRGGTNDAAELPPKSNIKAAPSLVESLSGRAEDIAQKVEMVLNNLLELTGASRQTSLFQLVDNAAVSLDHFNEMMDGNQDNIQGIMTNLNLFTARLDTFMLQANTTLAQINTTINSPEVQQTLTHVHHITEDLEQAKLSTLLNELTLTVQQVKTTFVHLDLTLLKSRHDLLSSIETLKESMEYFNEFSRLISENPSLLIYKSKQEEIQSK
jgi:phospholipid/cholesterol/gamma-HCH transport system substrate-binding protein